MSSSVRRVTDRALHRGVEPEARPELAALGRARPRRRAKDRAGDRARKERGPSCHGGLAARDDASRSSPPTRSTWKRRRHEAATEAFLDRLRLDEARRLAIAQAVEEIAALADPVGRITARFERPNGLVIERVATPLGVVGVIFESRPNVMADASALCLKAGNASILRTGSASFRSAEAIHAASGRGPRAGGAAAPGDLLRPDARSWRGRRHAFRPRRHDRRHRAARRQEPRRAGAEGGARARLRPSRRRLPCLCASPAPISTWHRTSP